MDQEVECVGVLKVKQLEGFIEHPPLKYHYLGDVGMDLYACMKDPISIAASSFVDVPCGIAIKLPPGTWAMVTARSSAFFKRRLMVYTGIIDNGYTGALKIGVFNLDAYSKVINPLDALAQLILYPVLRTNEVRMVTELPNTERGVAGFGSTDKPVEVSEVPFTYHPFRRD